MRCFTLVIALMAFCHLTNATPLEWSPKVHHGQLDNGLKYVFYPSPKSSDPFNLRLIINVGSVDDPAGQKGLAHIVEHMVFRANRQHQSDIHHYLDTIGWETGKQVNAHTRQTDTQFMIRTRPDDSLDLNQSIALLSDMAFSARILSKEWAVERQVILQEKRLTDSVGRRISEEKKRIVRNGSRYVDRPTIGDTTDINAITAKQIRAFYHRFYVPENMTIVASGAIDPQVFTKALQEHFARQPAKPVPERSYVELPLYDHLKIGQVQDEQGSTSAVVFGLRSALLAKNTQAGELQRLQHYFLRKLLPPLLRGSSQTFYSHETSEHKPSDNNNLSVHLRLKSPTNNRILFALYTKTSQHKQGLHVVLQEIERLKQNGITQQQLNTLKHKVRNVIKRNQRLIAKRDYAKWDDKITSAILQGSVEQDYAQKSQRLLRWIDAMTVEQLNQRLRELLSAKDQFLYYQIPGGEERTLPTPQQVKHLQATFANQVFAAAQPKYSQYQQKKSQPDVNIDWPALPKPPAHIVSQARHYQHTITRWQLNNGDTVTWLKQATPRNMVYVKALSNAGYQNMQQPIWLSQVAHQIWAQSDLAFASNKDVRRFQHEQGVQWHWSQNAQTLDGSATIHPQDLTQLMQIYHSQQTQWQFDLHSVKAMKAALLKESTQPSKQQQERDRLLGIPADTRITPQALKQTPLATFKQTANELQQQPVNLFIVGDIPEQRIKTIVLPALASIQRQDTLVPRSLSLPAGQHRLTQKTYSNDMATVTIKSDAPMVWTPEKSFVLSTLNPMIKKALKNELRIRLGGIYSTRYELSLDKDDRVRSSITLTTAPERVEEMIDAYHRVMAQFAKQLPHENLPRLRHTIAKNEAVKMANPPTLLRRLALSYQRYQTPHYLTSLPMLEQSVTLDTLNHLVESLLPFKNEAIVIRLPHTEHSH
ncbi:M16 family metallopeptidase [Vibrio palustris]|uniref:Peptidase M16 inactive domain protein n=1 Tax=Vibrio palustris TaxID=1918946 RepID=A0A1R4B4S4_9VIBR|nr:insulinase family protein [Vibrio palustris]SJL83922.1 Peptidase M16 inactive domain protein [Vibrio palustris]